MLRKEGGKFTKETFVDRLRFRPMTRRDWRYSLLALVVIGLLTSGIMIAMQVLFSDFNHTPSFMTLDPLSPERYWLLFAWFPYWLLNIGGEEFFWRGVLLPRQEKIFGDKTWILHGTGWAIFHIAFGWQLLVMLLPLLYIKPYVVQKTQNTWTGVFLHGVINGPSFITIALGIIWYNTTAKRMDNKELFWRTRALFRKWLENEVMRSNRILTNNNLERNDK